MGAGVPIGIACARSPRLYAWIRPTLDLMQTLPSFVYLIPAIVFFGIGMTPGLIATAIFVLPAPIRMTHLGITSTPRDLVEADLRQKEIRFSSRTRLSADNFHKAQTLRRALSGLLRKLPTELRDLPETRLLAAEADEANYNIIELIYDAPNYEGTSKDYEFSRRTMEEHWAAGFNDTVRTLRHPREPRVQRLVANDPRHQTGLA